MVELRRALSNPRLLVELKGLSDLKQALSDSLARRSTQRELSPRQAPIISTVKRVLADGEPMELKDIHLGCMRLLGADVSYRALKNGLSEHQRRKHRAIVRVSRGYRLS